MKQGPRVNTDILNEEIRCISSEGEQLGVMKTADAIAEADAQGLDLVEVSPNTNPPVCKIIDIGGESTRPKSKTINTIFNRISAYGFYWRHFRNRKKYFSW